MFKNGRLIAVDSLLKHVVPDFRIKVEIENPYITICINLNSIVDELGLIKQIEFHIGYEEEDAFSFDKFFLPRLPGGEMIV